jgi:hypothetical protein
VLAPRLHRRPRVSGRGPVVVNREIPWP